MSVSRKMKPSINAILQFSLSLNPLANVSLILGVLRIANNSCKRNVFPAPDGALNKI